MPLFKNKLNEELINGVGIHLFASSDVGLVFRVILCYFKAQSSLSGPGPLYSAKRFLLSVPVAVSKLVSNKSIIVWVLFCQPVYPKDDALRLGKVRAKVGMGVPLIDRMCGEKTLWKQHGPSISVWALIAV